MANSHVEAHAELELGKLASIGLGSDCVAPARPAVRVGDARLPAVGQLEMLPPPKRLVQCHSGAIVFATTFNCSLLGWYLWMSEGLDRSRQSEAG